MTTTEFMQIIDATKYNTRLVKKSPNFKGTGIFGDMAKSYYIDNFTKKQLVIIRACVSVYALLKMGLQLETDTELNRAIRAQMRGIDRLNKADIAQALIIQIINH